MEVGFYSGVFGTLTKTNRVKNLEAAKKCVAAGLRTHHAIGCYGVNDELISMIDELESVGMAHVNVSLAGSTKVESMAGLGRASIAGFWHGHETAEAMTFQQRLDYYDHVKPLIGGADLRTYPLGSITHVLALAKERDVNPATGARWEEHIAMAGECDSLHFSAFVNLDSRADDSLHRQDKKYPGAMVTLQAVKTYFGPDHPCTVHADVRESDFTNPTKFYRLKQHMRVLAHQPQVTQFFFRTLSEDSKLKVEPSAVVWEKAAEATAFALT